MTDAPWTWSDEHEQVFKAYIAALNAGLRVAKDTEVVAGSYSYKHATLEATLNAIEGVLTEHKVRVATLPAAGPDSASWALIVTLLHEDGEWMAFPPYVRPLVKDEQGHGSALTYGRRYALTAIFSLLAGDDDDGKAATELVRNENQLNGNRTEEELAIRVLLKHLSAERRSLIVGEFKEAFGKILADLSVGKHRDALDWMAARIQQPDPEPADDPAAEDAARPDEERQG